MDSNPGNDTVRGWNLVSFVPTPQSYAAILGEIHRLTYFFGLFFSCRAPPPSHDITQYFSVGLFFCSGVFLARQHLGVKLEAEVSRHHPVRLGFLVLTDWDLGHQTAHIGTFQ